jgi:hypothetical protein
MWETQLHRPNTLKANDLPETNGVRASCEIPLYSRLKEELKSLFTSHIHVGRGLETVDTDITRTSREWRPEGSPTNDETLLILLSRKIRSVVVVSVVFCSLQKKICH